MLETFIPLYFFGGLLLPLLVARLIQKGNLNPLCLVFGHDMVRYSKKVYLADSELWFWVRCSRKHCKHLEARKA